MTEPVTESGLPAYEQLTHAPRWQRWQGWIEKRGQERREIKLAEGKAPTSWSLDEIQVNAESGQDLTARTGPSVNVQASAPRRASSCTRLTTQVALHECGDRFDTHLPSKPLCSAVIRIHAIPYFLVLGLETGLYVLDIHATPNTLSSAKYYQIWSSLPIHAVEILDSFDEFHVSVATGVLVMLIQTNDGHNKVQIFPLQAIINLCQSASLHAEHYASCIPSFPYALTTTPTEKGKGKTKESKRASVFLSISKAFSDPAKSEEQKMSSLTIHDEPDSSFVVVDDQNKQQLEPLQEWMSSNVELKLPTNCAQINSMQILIPRDSSGKTYYLALICRSVIYLYLAQPSKKRSFTLVHDFYLPAVPRNVTLVRLQADATEDSLALFVGMSNKAVLISLHDANVKELQIASPAISSSAMSRSRSSSTASNTDKDGSSKRKTRERRVKSVIEAAKDLVGAVDVPVSCAAWQFGSGTAGLYFITRGQTTHATCFKSSAQSAAHLDAYSRAHLQVPSLYEWHWQCPSIKSTCVWTKQLGDSEFVLVLVASSQTSVEVQETVLRFSVQQNLSQAFAFTSAQAEEEMDTQAIYDWNAPISIVGNHTLLFEPKPPEIWRADSDSSFSSSTSQDDDVRKDEEQLGLLLAAPVLNEYKLYYLA